MYRLARRIVPAQVLTHDVMNMMSHDVSVVLTAGYSQIRQSTDSTVLLDQVHLRDASASLDNGLSL
jgi:hypothetical protein